MEARRARASLLLAALRPKLRGDRRARGYGLEEPSCAELRGCNGLLAWEEAPPLGSHLVTLRSGFLHHGIYVGSGNVVHYAGLVGGLHRGPVEEVSLARFTRGRPVWIRSHAATRFDAQEVIRRARSRVGEDCYRLLTNNCEHFCEWCLHGEHRSYQVEAWRARPGRALHATMRFIAQSHVLMDTALETRAAPTARDPIGC